MAATSHSVLPGTAPSSLPRPLSSYRAARRNAWRSIPKKDRPTWRAFTTENPPRPKRRKAKAA